MKTRKQIKAAEDRQYSEFRRDLIEARGQRCEIQESTLCDAFKMRLEVHHILTRGRGGRLLDPDNCLVLCPDCHGRVHDHPKWATEKGYLRHSPKVFKGDATS